MWPNINMHSYKHAYWCCDVLVRTWTGHLLRRLVGLKLGPVRGPLLVYLEQRRLTRAHQILLEGDEHLVQLLLARAEKSLQHVTPCSVR